MLSNYGERITEQEVQEAINLVKECKENNKQFTFSLLKSKFKKGAVFTNMIMEELELRNIVSQLNEERHREILI